MKTIAIEIPDGKKAEWVNGVLTLIDDRPADVRERVKTFEDAFNELDPTNNIVIEYTRFSIVGIETPDILAYLKLRIIVAALNEGWKPQFTENEERWFPWYYIYTEEELAEKSDEWKKSHTILDPKSRVVGRANGSCVYASTSVASSFANTSNGARLAFRTEELAEYAGKQFIEIYAQYLFNT